MNGKQKKLSELKMGVKAKIVSFENDEIYLKLMEMGCIPGEDVKIDHMAPMGGPIAIVVSGYNLSLRMDEAEKIVVEEL